MVRSSGATWGPRGRLAPLVAILAVDDRDDIDDISGWAWRLAPAVQLSPTEAETCRRLSVPLLRPSVHR